MAFKVTALLEKQIGYEESLVFVYAAFNLVVSRATIPCDVPGRPMAGLNQRVGDVTAMWIVACALDGNATFLVTLSEK